MLKSGSTSGKYNFLYYYLSKKKKNRKHLLRKNINSLKGASTGNYINLDTGENLDNYRD